MTATRKRVLIGQIFQEAHGFTPLRTGLASFQIETGQAVISNNREADSVLGGIIRTGLAYGWDLIPSIAARASPGGRVTDDAYAFIKQHIMDCAKRGGFDAIALCLHGCMQTESLDSAEEDLLASLRGVVGPELPIVAGFDLHAHANGGMLTHLDFASGYKTNPHADAGATGERVGHVLSSMLEVGLKPVGASVAVPMLTSGNDETNSGPLASLHARARDRVAGDENLLDASIFNVNPFIDGEKVGQTALVYARNEAGWLSAKQLAEDLANGLWTARKEFCHQLPSLTQALAHTRGRLVIGDFGDRVLAGGPGDSVYLLHELLRRDPQRHIVAPVTDPEALHTCQKAGVGVRLAIKLGGCYTRNGLSITLNGIVRNLGDISFRNRGTFMKGASLRIGPFAVFESEQAVILITQDPLMSQDPGCFIDTDIDLTKAEVIIAKSGYHFKMAFDSMGTCICVSTPGLTNFEPVAANFAQARPIFPLDEFPFLAKALRTRR